VTDFNFDLSKRFIDNCVGFLEDVKDIDPEMASILEQNWDKLLAVVIEGDRDTKARTAFNEAVATALDGLLAPKAEEESK
jgi:hypothetical protein